MFITRLISGIILVLLLAGITAAGGPVFFAAVAAISLIGLKEYYHAVGLSGTGPAAAGFLAAAAHYAMLYFKVPHYGMITVIGGFILMMGIYVMTFPGYSYEKMSMAAAGLIYPGVMLSCLVVLRNHEAGPWLVTLAFLGSWGCDTLAYCAGRLFGKHKMTPVLSPHKTIEGAVGGTLGAALLGFLFGTFLGNRLPGISSPQLLCTIGCGLAALVSQIGDLAASGIKRDHQIKDYGHLIPGHGGILDRFDSVIFTAPAILLAVMLLGA